MDVQNPDYNMKSDSLQYNSRSKVIYFVTTTTVTDMEGNTFVYEDGEYNTSMRKSILGSGTAETPEYQLKGARYSLDDIRKVYHVSGNVVMTSKKENLIIYGQQADYYKNRGITKVYDHAYLAKVTDDNDTLFMRADTLVSIDNEDPAKKRLLAYHHVKIYKSDLQGVADSVEYRAPDSTIYFYQHPVLWSQGNQMTADSISMLIENNTVSRIFLVANAFVISQDTLVNYNQIKGRDMTAEVKQGKINRVYVDGNAESLYFVLDEKTMAFTGMNKMVCSSILIRFKDGQVDNMTSYQQPDAHFIPPHELGKDQRALKGFTWLNDKRPTRAMVVENPVADPSEKKPDAATPKTQPKQSLPQKPRRRSNSDKQ
ncbi:MAG: hypothetical protein HC859_12270 [Bacteroidia bacterium]|nr:hypothetical protein [Bacteroidia bacterium]